MEKVVSPAQLRELLRGEEELCVVDVREELTFSEGHLLHARSVPLSRLELKFRALVPRLGTPIVVCHTEEALARKACTTLRQSGYRDVSMLAGGIAAWISAGYEMFSGVNVPSKAFGEYVEHSYATPSIAPEELHEWIAKGADITVLDSRPFDEFQRVSIPTALSCPGAELVLRIRDAVPSEDTTIVVNCAGRTRSLLGAQSLLNAGVPNKVVALRNGTMGWSLAGFETESMQTRRVEAPSPASIAWANDAVRKLESRLDIRRISLETVRDWQADPEKTTYLLDVRDPSEYERGHVAGSVSAPGGQLVQATDQYAGTMRSRLVLIDELGVRASMTASWLRQMGWNEVYVLAEAGTEQGNPAPTLLHHDVYPDAAITPEDLQGLMDSSQATVLDLSGSRAYRAGHIQGAAFAIRSRLDRAIKALGITPATLVLTSEDGVLASLAVAEATALTQAPVRYLAGGNGGWVASRKTLHKGEEVFLDDPVDVWLKPYERGEKSDDSMREYLSWEVDLLEKIRAEGSCNFSSI
jgi:rhodanese-related sulfurtransferase